MTKRISWLLVIFFLFLSGCSHSSNEYVTKNFFAMDTFFSITLSEPDAAVLGELVDLALKLEEDLTIHDPNGDLGSINQAEGKPVTVSNFTIELLGNAIKFAEEMNGYYDPSTEVVTELWDFNKEIIPSQSELESALKFVNYQNISIAEEDNTVLLKEGMKIGAGAIAKGFAVKKQVEVLMSEDINHALVTAGGNMFALGTKKDGEPWKIEIRHPRKDNDTIGFVLLENLSIDTSGDYERFFEKNQVRYHHVLNPKTGYSDSDLISVTVICKDPAMADAYSTGLLAMGLERAKEFVNSHPEVDAILVDKAMNIYVSEELKGCFSSKAGDEIYY